MRKWTIGKRLLFGFSGVLLVFVSVVLFARLRSASVEKESAAIRQNVAILADLAILMRDSEENQTLIYKHIYSSSPEDMDRLEARMKANTEECNPKVAACLLAAQSEEIRASITKADQFRDGYRKLRDQILSASRGATNAEQSAALCAKARAESTIRSWHDTPGRCRKLSGHRVSRRHRFV